MSLTYLKHGEQSAEWASAVSVAEDLVWSVCPDRTMTDARSHLLKLIPGLLKKLRTGLGEASYDPFKSSELLKSLEGLHIDALQMLASAGAETVKPKQEQTVESRQDFTDLVKPSVVEKTDTSALDSDIDQAGSLGAMSKSMDSLLDDVDSILDGVAGKDEISETASVKHEQVAHSETASESNKTIENTINSAVVEKSTSEPVQQKADVVVDAASVEMIESLRVGSWLEFHEAGKVVRCKLAALIRVTGKYIFVDRSGIKIADKNKSELLEMAQLGLVNILNDGLLFDRALESVIGNLRDNRQD